MTDLKKVIADFPKTNAYAVLDDLVRVCGVDSVLSALFEINAAQQQRVPDEAVCAPEIHALPGEDTIGDCLFCGKPLRR